MTGLKRRLFHGLGAWGLGLAFSLGPIPLLATDGGSCVACHAQLDDSATSPVNQWMASIHKKSGIACADCHGGDPKASGQEKAMSKSAGFRGVPSRMEIPLLCGGCHSDPVRMKPFNQRIDQLAEYRTSTHGKLLFEKKDPNVAICTDCHGNHEVLEVSDGRSPVYKRNVPKTCSRCHANVQKMAPYGIRTDQYSQYMSSYHAYQLLEKDNNLAPTCADCHGKHGAAPPGIQSVVYVCGNCHSAIEANYLSSPHGAAMKAGSSGAPLCVNCHGSHAIPYPKMDWLVGANGAQDICGTCHDKGTKAGKLAVTLYEEISRYQEDLKKTQLALTEMEEKTLANPIPIREKFFEAQTKLTEVRPIIHTMNLDKIHKPIKEGEALLAEVKAFYTDKFREARHLKIQWGIVAAATLFLVFLIYLLRRAIPNPYEAAEKEANLPADPPQS